MNIEQALQQALQQRRDDNIETRRDSLTVYAKDGVNLYEFIRNYFFKTDALLLYTNDKLIGQIALNDHIKNLNWR